MMVYKRVLNLLTDLEAARPDRGTDRDGIRVVARIGHGLDQMTHDPDRGPSPPGVGDSDGGWCVNDHSRTVRGEHGHREPGPRCEQRVRDAVDTRGYRLDDVTAVDLVRSRPPV